MYEKYGVTNKNKAPQKKIKLASNENIISNSTKIGAFHLKNPCHKQDKECSNESLRSHIAPITSLNIPSNENKKDETLMPKSLGNSTKLGNKGKFSKGRIYKQSEGYKRKLSNDPGALDILGSRAFPIHKNNFMPVLGKATPENSQLEVVKARNIKSGNPQSRKNLNRRRNLSEDRAKRNVKSKSHSKKRMNSSKVNKPNMPADNSKSKNIVKIEGSFKDGITSTSTTSNIAKGTNISEYSDKAPCAGSNKRVLQMLNNKVKASNDSKCSNNTASKENKLPNINKNSKQSDNKNLFRKRKQNEKNLDNKTDEVKKFVNSFSASQNSNKSVGDSNNSRKNLISDEVLPNSKIDSKNKNVPIKIEEGVKAFAKGMKGVEDNDNPYQLPVDCEEDNSTITAQSRVLSTVQSNVLSESKKQNLQSNISKEIHIKVTQPESVQVAKIEIVANLKNNLDKNENLNPSQICSLPSSDKEKCESKETVIKHSNIYVSKDSEENKGLKIKQKSKVQSELPDVHVESTENESHDNKEDINHLKKRTSHKIEEVLEQSSSPLLDKEEKYCAVNYGFSLDSKKVNEAIGLLDIELICKCIAHAILKHIDFSRGELLIDDLVEEDEDIPQFSYNTL